MNANVVDLFADVNENTSLYNIIGEGMATLYSEDTWIGSLAEINRKSGYWLKYYDFTQDFNLIGIKTKCSETSYDLNYGNNLISYVGSNAISIENAIPSEFTNQIQVIIGEGISAMNINGGWIGSLQYLMLDDGYWIRVNEHIDAFQWECGEDLAREKVITPAVSSFPEGFSFNQSTTQAFYFVENVVIDGESIEIDDWLIAYQGDEVVGARQWTGGITDIPAMGNDGSENSINYLQNGSIPQFKLLKEGRLIDLVGDIPAWSNNGVFMLSELKSATALPESFSVNDAYPNPFNPTTTLKFSLPIEMNVSISIYNLNGREVVTLQNGNMDAGYHSVIWNADLHSSGGYFMKMVAGEFINSQKLILIK